MTFEIPTYRQRTTVVGRTGSGKTQFAAWLLSVSPFDKQPYIIFDYKHDELFNAIERAEIIRLGEIPRQPGVYIVQPLPHEEVEVNDYLWKLWAKEKVGLLFDEMYNIPDPMKRSALRAILTQGRSKRIPAICLTQRPAWVSRFIFSEADHYALFHLNTEDDKRRIESFFPGDIRTRLPDYHSMWYSVGNNTVRTLGPAPDAETILQRFDDRLRRRRWKL